MLRAIPAAALGVLISVSSQAQSPSLEGDANRLFAEANESLSAEFLFSPKSTTLPLVEPLGEPKTEDVKLTASDGVVTHAVFYVPKKPDSRAPAALLVHDAGESGESLVHLAEYLYKRGFAVLLLDLRGHGKSSSEDTAWDSLDEDARERLWASALDDVHAGAVWLRQRKEVHSSNLTVLGVRASCALAARHAVNDENARAAVLVAPSARTLGFDVLRDLRSLGGLPTLILCEKAGRQEAVRMSDASHNANGGQIYIKVQYMKCKSEKLVTDKKLKSTLGSWLREQVMPRRGR